MHGRRGRGHIVSRSMAIGGPSAGNWYAFGSGLHGRGPTVVYAFGSGLPAVRGRVWYAFGSDLNRDKPGAC